MSAIRTTARPGSKHFGSVLLWVPAIHQLSHIHEENNDSRKGIHCTERNGNQKCSIILIRIVTLIYPGSYTSAGTFFDYGPAGGTFYFFTLFDTFSRFRCFALVM
jgi:hypothetical protein